MTASHPPGDPEIHVMTLAQLAAALSHVECGHVVATVELDLASNRCRYRCPACDHGSGWQQLV
ncbi:MAG: hypothetical protein ACREPA_07330 [Candidatus Dormibacteraceae bacterium]